MEHLSTFGLTRDPFASEAALDAVLETSGFEDATRRLERFALQGKGLALLTGAGGVGKTVLVRHALESLEEEVFEACMLVPVPGITDGAWMLTRFAAQLGVEEPASDLGKLLGQIYEQMAIVREDGRHTVLLVDEAQVLADQGILAQLRGLLNLEYEDKRLLSLVLVGLPSLAEAVDEEPALCDRVDLRIALPSLDEATSAAYLDHRIRAVGGNPAILESSARAALVKWGAGIPRRLNTLADNALFEAHLAGRVSATAEDVEKAAAELGLMEATEAAPMAAAPEVELPAPAPAPVEAAPAAAEAPMPLDAMEPVPLEEAEPEPSFEFAEAVPEPRPEPSSLDGIFDESSPALELKDVVAAPTDPQYAGAGATVAFLDDAPLEPAATAGRPAADATVAFLADVPPASVPASAAPDATVAILSEPEPAPAAPASHAAPAQTMAIFDDPNGSTDGELDDLFAELVDE